MRQFYRLLFTVILLPGMFSVKGQVTSCPLNIDFEQGNFLNWACYTGLNYGGPAVTWSQPGPPVGGRHTITSGQGTDPLCGIPVVAPGGGLHAVILGNNQVQYEMERIAYTFTIPAGINNYSLIYRYAIVMQDPGHDPKFQPFFSVIAYDDASGLPIACDSSHYVSSSNLPGFAETAPGSNIWYKDWTTASLKLAGLAGRTVRVEFTTADCGQGAHFGYGYVDVSCGLFKITSANCNSAATTPLVAPPGFQDYTWYNASYTTVLGTGQTIHIPTPATTTDYHVILTPYPGYGCTDTLTTQVLFSTLTVNATPDSANLCHTSQVQLNATQAGSAPPYTYSWAPAAGLNCIFCPNPLASPTVNTAYTVSVTDAIGCTVTDTVTVVAPLSLTETHTDVSCNGGNNGSITVGVAGGVPPYSYSWNTSPQQTASAIQNLGPGVYTVTVRDVTNCMATKTIIISQPPPMTVTVSSTDIRCAGVGAGMAWVRAAGGVAPYSYSWNTVPPQSNDTAFGLPAGTYTCTVIDANRCVKTISSTINESNPFTVSTQLIKRSCPGELNSEVRALVLGGVGTIRYSWNTNPVRSTPVLDRIGQGTYIITVQDSVGCIARDTIVVTDFPGPVVTAGNEVEICEGESTTLNAGGALTYQWYASSPTLSCINCPSTIVTPDTTTVYYVIGTDVNGCKDTGLVTVHVLQRMPVTVDSTRRICLGEEVMLGATGGIYYEWTPVDNMDGPFLPNPVARPTKTTTYQVIITENRCFKDTLQQTVVVMPLPTINIMNGFSGIPGAMVPLTTTVANAQTITWWPPAGLSCTDCFQPVATLDKSIIYVAEVSDSIGCKARDTIRIIVGCDGNAFYLANTFTPNNDGQNDYFYPQGLGVNKVNRFMVYNRWGEVVFAASDLPVNVQERGWDGLFHGKELPPDVFVYVVEAICPDGSPVVLKGDVTLVR
jgi:gliding motility-associated-like protein